MAYKSTEALDKETNIINTKIAIRRKNLAQLLDISTSHLDGMLNIKSKYYDRNFPKPKRLGTRTVVWLVQDILDYLKQKDDLENGGKDNKQSY